MFTESFGRFFDVTAGFAEYVTIGAGQVAVIFDEAFADPLGIVAGTRPTFLAASSDVSTLAVGASVTRGAVTYTVTELQPDGTGVTKVMLK